MVVNFVEVVTLVGGGSCMGDSECASTGVRFQKSFDDPGMSGNNFLHFGMEQEKQKSFPGAWNGNGKYKQPSL